MKDVNLSEDTIEKTEILMNLARAVLFLFGLCIFMMSPEMTAAQSGSMTGIVSQAEILENNRIYSIYKDRYQPEESAINYLKTYDDSVDVMVFWGSWCKESKKHIPSLIKTLELAGNAKINTQYIGVDVSKEFPQEFLNKFDIKYIPTVVVLKGNAELGRIEEEPQLSIETDFVQILQKDDKGIE
ncbi:thioredoxin family protein [Gracilimonas sp.]|uniref:thioredoxin family protein n=1 Tax=Gracilimonas sp. TaxID=1974203 RepID=UPI002871E91B|nr:thioredoxin family protein [Gracilimonas sp.]